MIPTVVVSAFSGSSVGVPPVTVVGKLVVRAPVGVSTNGFDTGAKLLAEARNSSAKLGARMSRDWVARRRSHSTGSQLRLSFQVVASNSFSADARRWLPNPVVL